METVTWQFGKFDRSSDLHDWMLSSTILVHPLFNSHLIGVSHVLDCMTLSFDWLWLEFTNIHYVYKQISCVSFILKLGKILRFGNNKITNISHLITLGWNCCRGLRFLFASWKLQWGWFWLWLVILKWYYRRHSDRRSNGVYGVFGDEGFEYGLRALKGLRGLKCFSRLEGSKWSWGYDLIWCFCPHWVPST